MPMSLPFEQRMALELGDPELRGFSKAWQAAKDLVQLAKVPHSLAVLIALAVFFGSLYILVLSTVKQLSDVAHDEAFRNATQDHLVALNEWLATKDIAVPQLQELAGLDTNATDPDTNSEEPTIVELEKLVADSAGTRNVPFSAAFRTSHSGLLGQLWRR